MSDHQAVYPVRTMCRLLGLSPSGYYAWRQRTPSRRARENAVLTEEILEIHARSDGTYGAPRIHAELRARERDASLNRVARLMRAAEIEGVSRRRKGRTTRRSCGAQPAADLVERDFSASGPDELWVADITYVPTQAGFLYLAVVVDAWSRRVVGWSMATHLRTSLVLNAFDMALMQRQPDAVIHHSDQGAKVSSSGRRNTPVLRGLFLGPCLHQIVDRRQRRGPDPQGILDVAQPWGSQKRPKVVEGKIPGP